MRRSTIMQRLALLAAVPLIALSISSAIQVWQALATFRDAGQTQYLMDLSVSIGNLVHTLQIERGATAGFVQSRGQRLADILPGARNRTDDKLEDYRKEAARLDSAAFPALRNAIAAANGKLEALNDLRRRADQFAVPAADTTAYYTSAIAQLVNAIGTGVEYNKDAAISQKVIAYIAFVRAKENAGQERALTTAVYAANRIEPAQFRTILDRISRQEAHLADFRSVAGTEEQASLQTVLAGAPAQEVERMRAVLIAKSVDGGFDIDPTTWFKAITAKIDAMHETENLITANTIAAATTLHTASRNAFLIFVALGAAAIALTIGVSVWVARSVSVPLREVVAFAEHAIRESDFTRTTPEAGTMEVARSAQAFNHLMQKMREILSGAKLSSSQITQATQAMAESSHQVRESSLIQSDAASSVAAAVEQASVSVSETAANARAAADVVARAREDNEHALRVMRETITQMNGIAQIIGESGANVERLDESSQKIGGIVKVIKDIADQTNLLALNAAIEAARAGEQGRGFAVVADEVRKLAERTGQATSEIASLIADIQAGIGGTVGAMRQANQQAGASLELVGRTETALHRIDDGSRAVASNVESISNALAEQDAAIRQIAVSVEQIAQMTERNTSAAERNNHTATDLNELSVQLRAAVAAFKV
ncbi:MAG: methyl-accepting chemotaxis protein [Rhodocyclaceae bacterium]|nr:methyl-accepting chemotaxis protein [Rhodocyclaceae bacterium]